MKMKLVSTYLLLAGTLISAGCHTDSGQRRQDSPKTAAASRSSKTAEDDEVPPAVVELLPSNQWDESNANDQAEKLRAALMREKEQLDKTSTASRE